MKIDKLDLLKKGWSTEEIAHAAAIIDEAEDKKHVGAQFLDKTVFGVALFVLVVLNIISAILLLPFLFTLQGGIVNVIIAIVGMVFGIIFTILIADIDRLNRAHHRAFLITFIVSGIINFAIITKFVQDISAKTTLPIIHNAYILGGTYIVTFLVPYGIYMIFERRKK